MKIVYFIISLLIFQVSFSQTNSYSVYLNGVNDQVNAPNILSSLPEGSIEVWFKLENWGTGSAGSYVYSGTSSVNYDRISLGIHPVHSNFTHELLFGIYSGSWNFAHSNIALTPNVYYQLTGTWGPGGIKLYINGTLVGNHPYMGAVPSTINTIIGSSSWANSFVNGNIDEFRIWDIALDSLQIQEYMECPPTGNEVGLLSYINFEEGVGVVSNDVSSNGNNVLLNNSLMWNNDVPNFNCCVLNPIITQPSNQTVSIGDDALFEFTDVLSSGTYQWQMQVGNSFINLSNMGQYNGVDSKVFTISSVQQSNETNYRCIITGATDECKDTTEVVNLSVLKNTSINEFHNSILSISINKNNKIFTFNINQSIQGEIVIFNTIGQEILKRSINSKTVNIDFNSLNVNGVYLSKLIDDQGRVLAVEKFAF